MYDRLKAPAKSLGSAFQKVNFLRDLQSDYHERGRTYFPHVDFAEFNEDAKQAIEADIQKDFDDAYQGIIKLPKGAKLGVYLAYTYYLKLFTKIKRLSPTTIMHQRVRVPDARKMTLLLQTYFKYQFNAL
jgi:phytoene/squalene synthetase